MPNKIPNPPTWMRVDAIDEQLIHRAYELADEARETWLEGLLNWAPLAVEAMRNVDKAVQSAGYVDDGVYEAASDYAGHDALWDLFMLLDLVSEYSQPSPSPSPQVGVGG
jgi:hypothetical protein